ncbi:serine hydrolase [Alicyclobacillus sp. ALC3]|uniref:serine hydrolase n=1 Tax=Alicyclobacillus sp. ALC3 TaxID=2796143 RepID=UPI002378C36A|nr:serine hydrolase [Alicyclobacillus sp. ALC3]WDL95487.1 serine hydrolase [Alicyclobacillus sp. ALC3]
MAIHNGPDSQPHQTRRRKRLHRKSTKGFAKPVSIGIAAIVPTALVIGGFPGFAMHNRAVFDAKAQHLQAEWNYDHKHGITSGQLQALRKELATVTGSHEGIVPTSWAASVNGADTELQNIGQQTAHVWSSTMASSRQKAEAAWNELQQVNGGQPDQQKAQNAINSAQTPAALDRLIAAWSSQVTEIQREQAQLKRMSGGLVNNQPADVVRLEQQLSALVEKASGDGAATNTAEEALAAAKQYFNLPLVQEVSEHAQLVQQLTDAIAKLAAAEQPPVTSNKWLFNSAFTSYLNSRNDTVSVAVYNANNGHTYLYNRRQRYDTASIVKMTILADLLHTSGTTGQPLPTSEQKQAVPMIEDSSNNAASTLWNDAGGSTAIQSFLTKAGMTDTTPGSGGQWGLTRTTAQDQVDLMRLFAYPNNLLSTSERDYGLNLMEHVIASEDWGVSSGPLSAGASVALKNGWLPYPQKWWVNSVGYVNGDGRNYVIAVLSAGNVSEQYGVHTDDKVSQMVWTTLGQG